MSHDPLCRAKFQEWEQYLPCLDCVLIAKVRADQAARIVEHIRAYGDSLDEQGREIAWRIAEFVENTYA